MKRDKMILLVGIFLVAIILSTIHHSYREGMSHHAEKQQLKGEQHAESLIEKDITHKEKTMQDSNQYSDDIHNHWDSEDHEDIHHTLNSKYNDDSSLYNSDDEENVYGSGNEEQLDDEDHHKHHHKHHDKHHKQNHNLHHKQHHKHHNRQHYNPDEEPMNTMNDDSMYMLKSESVPPICPACPQTTACPKKKPCPPCPPCARCPDNNFECKKVPNYEGGNSSLFPANMFGPTSTPSNEDDSSAPQPYLNSFAQF